MGLSRRRSAAAEADSSRRSSGGAEADPSVTFLEAIVDSGVGATGGRPIQIIATIAAAAARPAALHCTGRRAQNGMTTAPACGALRTNAANTS